MILKTKKSTYKVLALLVLFCFSATNVWAMPGLGIEVAVPRETPAFLQIEIPSDIASIEEVYEAPAQDNPKLILHVQNIHGNYESQVKIKKLLEYLYDKYGFKLIFAEGAVDKLDPELLRLYPDAERNLKLADSMTKSGELTGIEYFLMEGPRDVEAVGIEETQLYRKDYQAFRKVYAVKDESDAYLSVFEGKLETLASRIFSSNTRRLLSEWRKFEDGHRDFLPYVKRLTIDAKSVLGLDLESLFAQVEWPQITRLLALQTMEKDLDQNAAMKEKERLLKFLTEQQVSPEIGEAIQKLHERKITVTRTDDAEKRLEDLPRYLFERLASEAGPKGFRFHDYPAFSLWAGHMILQNELDSKLLFEEIDKVFSKVLDEMTVSEREKNLMELYRDEVLLKKLLHLELTRKEWERVVYRKDWIDIRPMVGRLKKLSEEYDAGKEPADIWAKLGEGAETSQVETVRKAVETGFQFYDLARQRENVFYDTISTQMESKNIDKAVVVTGGFHTEGLMDIFREKEINCSILMPRIAGDLSTDEYISSMMENKPVMFDLATIENVPHMSLLMQQMSQRSDVANPKAVAYEIARTLQSYLKIYGQVDTLEQLKSDLEFFNNSRFAARDNADIRLELAQDGTQKIWIRYKGTLVSADDALVEIPFTLEGGKVVVQDHTEAGPKVETVAPEVMTREEAPAEKELAAAGRSEIRNRPLDQNLRNRITAIESKIESLPISAKMQESLGAMLSRLKVQGYISETDRKMLDFISTIILSRTAEEPKSMRVGLDLKILAEPYNGSSPSHPSVPTQPVLSQKQPPLEEEQPFQEEPSQQRTASLWSRILGFMQRTREYVDLIFTTPEPKRETTQAYGPRMSRGEFLRLAGAAVAGAVVSTIPDTLLAQAPGAKKKDSAQIKKIMAIAEYYKLTLATEASGFAEKFTTANAESDLAYFDDTNQLFTNFSWRRLVMVAAKQLEAEGFTSDKVLTQEEVGMIARDLNKDFAIPPPAALKIGDDNEKDRSAKAIGPGASRKKTTENRKELQKAGLKNFQSLLQPTLEHDELIMQNVKALVKLWLSPEDVREVIFKEAPKNKKGNYENLVKETLFFAKGIPKTDEEKAAFADVVMYWAENIVNINGPASTFTIPKGPAPVYDPKNYYPGKERLIYRFTKQEALALVNSWIVQNNRINFAGVIQQLVLWKINYDQAERVTVDITRNAFMGDLAPQKALLDKVGRKADVPELQNVILELVPNTELEGILKLLPANEEELTTSAEKKKFYEGLKEKLAGGDWKEFGKFLKANGIDPNLLLLKLDVTFRKGKRNAKGEKEEPSFVQFFKDLAKANEEGKNVKELRAVIEGYRFQLISQGEIARITLVDPNVSAENTAKKAANEYRLKLGTITFGVSEAGKIDVSKTNGARRNLTTDASLEEVMDAYRNNPAVRESAYAANFLVHNGNMIWKRAAVMEIFKRYFGPGYEKAYFASVEARRRHAETATALNPAWLEGLDFHILSPDAPTLKNEFQRAMGILIDNAVNKTEESNPDPKAVINVQERLRKIIEGTPKGRHEIREIEPPMYSVNDKEVQFSLRNGDGIIAGPTLRTLVGNFEGARMEAYIDRITDDPTVQALLDKINSMELKAEVDGKVDPAEVVSVRASLEKLSGILSNILEKAEKKVTPIQVLKKEEAIAKEKSLTAGIVSEEEMLEALRVGVETLRHFLDLAADSDLVNMSPEDLVTMIAGGIMRDPTIAQVRAINRRLTGADAKTPSVKNVPSLEKLKVTDEAVSVISVVQMSQFNQADLLDPETGLLASIELLLRANPKASISLILVDDKATLTDQLLSNINLNLSTIQQALGGEETRLRVVRSSSDGKTLNKTLEMVRRQMMMGRIKASGIRMTQMGFMDKNYAELFETNAAVDNQFSEFVRNNASPLADSDKIFGAQLKEKPMMDILAGTLFAMLQASKTNTNGEAIKLRAQELGYDTDRIKAGRSSGFTDITDVISGVLVELMAAVRAEIHTSQAA